MTSGWARTRHLAFTRVLPIGFVIGAGMETFMNLTGFYDVALCKEAERFVARQERMEEEAARLKARQAALDAQLPPRPPA